MRITNPNIKVLAGDEIFVFGSNLSGRHGKGAAKFAMQKFGAEYGTAEGLTGRSYALPTVNASISAPLSVEEISDHIGKLLEICLIYPEKKFLVTEVGCGLAGLRVEDIAPLFREFVKLNNVWLPERFINYINNYTNGNS